MKNWIKKALTRKIESKGSKGKQQATTAPPSDNLLYAVYFSLGIATCLTALEAVHLIVLGTWNNEIFTVIAGLIGNITGIFLTQKT